MEAGKLRFVLLGGRGGPGGPGGGPGGPGGGGQGGPGGRFGRGPGGGVSAENAAAWICSIVFSVRLATGAWHRAHPLVYLVPSLVVGAHVWGNFLLGQPSLVLLALMLGAFIALQRKFHWLAGLLIAIAAAIKAFPVIAIIYLVYRRYWIAIASLVLTLMFLLMILPIPFRGSALTKQDLERWSSGMLQYDELWEGNTPVYVTAFADHLARHGLRYVADADVGIMNEAAFPPAVAAALAGMREKDLVWKEQYLDFLTLRRFRQTVFARAEVTNWSTMSSALALSLVDTWSLLQRVAT